jgi:TPR repeat protein
MKRLLLLFLVAAIPLCTLAQERNILDVIAEQDREGQPETWKPRAEAGDSEAQYKLAQLYLSGIGGSQDDSKGMYWLRESARQKYGMALFSLGRIYYLGGHGVTEDRSRAIQHFEAAAILGISQAAVWRARFGPQVDSYYWLKMAAEQGDTSAQYEVGWNYYFGQSGPQSYQEAGKWFVRAAKGHKDARFELGRSYAQGLGTRKDQKAAYVIFRSLIPEMHFEALNQIAQFYLNGIYVKRSLVAAYAIYNFMGVKFENVPEIAKKREDTKIQLKESEIEEGQMLTREMLASNDVISAIDEFLGWTNKGKINPKTRM